MVYSEEADEAILAASIAVNSLLYSINKSNGKFIMNKLDNDTKIALLNCEELVNFFKTDVTSILPEKKLSQFQIIDLPIPLLHEIFGYFPALDLVVLHRTCRHFRPVTISAVRLRAPNLFRPSYIHLLRGEELRAENLNLFIENITSTTLEVSDNQSDSNITKSEIISRYLDQHLDHSSDGRPFVTHFATAAGINCLGKGDLVRGVAQIVIVTMEKFSHCARVATSGIEVLSKLILSHNGTSQKSCATILGRCGAPEAVLKAMRLHQLPISYGFRRQMGREKHLTEFPVELSKETFLAAANLQRAACAALILFAKDKHICFGCNNELINVESEMDDDVLNASNNLSELTPSWLVNRRCEQVASRTGVSCLHAIRDILVAEPCTTTTNLRRGNRPGKIECEALRTACRVASQALCELVSGDPRRAVEAGIINAAVTSLERTTESSSIYAFAHSSSFYRNLSGSGSGSFSTAANLCAALAELCADEMGCYAAMSSGVISAVTKAMSSAMSSNHKTAKQDSDTSVTALLSNGCSVICEIARNCEDVSSINDATSGNLANSTKFNSNTSMFHSITSCGAIDEIINAMKAHPYDTMLLCNATRALEQIAGGSTIGANLIGDAGGVAELITIIKTMPQKDFYRKDRETCMLVQSVVMALAMLLSRSECCRESAAESGLLYVGLLLLRQWSNVAEIVAMTCLLMGELCTLRNKSGGLGVFPTNIKHIRAMKTKDEYLSSLASLLVQNIQRFPLVVDVQEHGCWALSELIAGTKEGEIAVLTTAAYSPSENLSFRFVDVIVTTLRSAAHCVADSTSDGENSINNSSQDWSHATANAAAILLSLSRNITLRNAIVYADGISILLRVIYYFSNDLTIQNNCMAVLERLSRSSKHRAKIVEENGFESMSLICGDDSDLHAFKLRGLALLSCCANTSQCLNLLRMSRKAKQMYPNNQGVQKSSMIAAKAVQASFRIRKFLRWVVYRYR